MINTSSGVDIKWTNGDIDARFALVSGVENILNALIRRLQTPRGGLFYDLDYGFDLTQFVNADVDSALLQEIRAGVVAECNKDSRVSGASAAVSYDPGTSSIRVAVSVATREGAGKFVANISKVTVAFLKQ